jgi:lipopolysaccharide/colanic/teichoic acid biosynthesis glycosyltransferase
MYRSVRDRKWSNSSKPPLTGPPGHASIAEPMLVPPDHLYEVNYRVPRTTALAGSAPMRRFRVRKRCLDVIVGSVLALVTLPLMIVMGIGVALSLRCWPLFRHDRPGRNGVPLTVVKLRTLPPATPAYADKKILDIAHMPLPWFCRVLRRSHLDELPQLFLVVTGAMSLVGPRPTQQPEIEPVEPVFSAIRTSIAPGCTGLWQLSTGSDGRIADHPEFDLFYVEHASIRLDLWIMVRTVGWMLGLVKPIELADIPASLCWRDAPKAEVRRPVKRRAAKDYSPVESREHPHAWTRVESDVLIDGATVGMD